MTESTRPAIYPCGCSHHKVDAGLCDLYAPGGGERSEAEPRKLDERDEMVARDTEARRLELLSIAQRAADLLDALVLEQGPEKRADYVLLVGELRTEGGQSAHITNVLFEGRHKAAIALASAVHSLEVMPAGGSFRQDFEDALALLRALRPRG